MRLTCREEEMIQCDELEMRQIESLLKNMPKEDLRCTKNGKHYKWFCMKEGALQPIFPKITEGLRENFSFPIDSLQKEYYII